MKKIFNFCVVFLVFVQFTNQCGAQPTSTPSQPIRAPCERLLMDGLDRDDKLPWIQMAGIYNVQNFYVGDFPVYKHESAEIFLFYNKTLKLMMIGTLYPKPIPLIAGFTDGTTRITYGSSLPFAPFRFITYWSQYDPALQRFERIWGSSGAIVPTCIDPGIQTCTSGMVEFDSNLTQVISNSGGRTIDLNVVGRDYYLQIPGFYSNQRPVYSLVRGIEAASDTFLYFFDGRWLVGPNITTSVTWLYTNGYAVRPELSQNSWLRLSNDRWSSVQAKIRCRAFPSNSPCSSGSGSSSCLNGGSCVTNSKDGLQFCQCANGWRGRTCEQRVSSCPDPKEFYNKLQRADPVFVIYNHESTYEGSVLTLFTNITPRYIYSTCQGRTPPLSWSEVKLPRTTTTATTTTTSWHSGEYSTKKFVFENNDSISVFVVSLITILVQMFCPVAICFVALCVVLYKAMQLDKVDDAEVENMRRIHQSDLVEFQRIHPGPVDSYDSETMQEFQRMVVEFQAKLNEIEEKKTDRTKEAKSRVKLFRTYSLYYYITFWIWLAYLVLYVTTNVFGGSVYKALYWVSIGCVILCYLVVLIEYRFSAEREYILNLSSTLFAAERIDAIRASQPSVVMEAVCYHYETRTRTVTYLDSNGYLQSRLETYKEKVITGTFTDTFVYSYWRDTSKLELAGIRQVGITKIKMTLNVDPGDEETAMELMRQYNEFRMRYKNYDEFVDYSKTNHVPGFQKRLAAYMDSKYKPWWINWYVFLAATVLCFGWPYRWIFNAVTYRTRYTVNKVIYVGQPRGEEIVSPYTSPPVLPEDQQGDGDNIGICAITVNGQNGDVELEPRPPPYSSLPIVA